MTACDLPRAPSPFCPPLCAGFRRVAAMFGAPARTTGPGGANPRVKGLAERVGFEPTEVSLSGFQDRERAVRARLTVSDVGSSRTRSGLLGTRSVCPRPGESGHVTSRWLSRWLYVPLPVGPLSAAPFVRLELPAGGIRK